ncbi:hypothetical protein [Pelagicoccus albus]|uniref:Methyl-accepting transducer domain-containing protein n=1 Tax=Pelagicoccus albus TaxID=415222 RepID=A0A7X1B6V6_9BACT|nr:hypothetical protein [Pelagicoccus albus]MBC2606745.1 hypothetical protein [Pelagicoccus albus]
MPNLKNSLSKMTLVKNLAGFVEKARQAIVRSNDSLSQSFVDTLTFKAKLENSSTRFESEFLMVGGALESLHSNSEHLKQESSTMLELSQSEQNPVKRIDNSLQPHLQFIGSSADSVKELVTTLENSSQSIGSTLAFEPQLEQTFSQLTYIRTLFAVEAAPLEQTDKVMFTSLVEEIHRLQTDVTGIFKDNFEALKKHRSKIDQISQSLKQQASSQLKVLDESTRELENSLRSQTEILEQNIATSSRLNTYGDEISNCIGNAIISLQTQDIVSQKLGHIYETSDETRERFEQAETTKNKAQKTEHLRFIENASMVIVNQIESIKDELRSADQSVDKSMRDIISSIKSMDSESQGSSSNRLVNEGESARGKSLIRVFEKADQTVSNIEKFLKEAFRTIEPIRSQTDSASSTIMTLSAQLHLIGLNAEIHAARIGGNTALETLSAKTSEISVETRDLCHSISSQLDTLSAVLIENVDQLETIQRQASQAHETISSELPLEKENLEEQNDLYAHAQVGAKQVTETLRSLTQNQSERLEFEETMLEALDGMQENQRKISSLAKKAADRLKAKADVPMIMSSLLSRYTMRSEKEVHLKTLGQDAHPAESDFETGGFEEFEDFSLDRHTYPASTETSSSQKAKDLGDNVDLF